MSGAPHIKQVREAAMVRLSEEATDQVIVISAQGTQVGIAVSVKPGTKDTWARVLREIADEIETGVSDADEFSDAFQGKKTLN